jgi:hypothetical protein
MIVYDGNGNLSWLAFHGMDSAAIISHSYRQQINSKNMTFRLSVTLFSITVFTKKMTPSFQFFVGESKWNSLFRADEPFKNSSAISKTRKKD